MKNKRHTIKDILLKTSAFAVVAFLTAGTIYAANSFPGSLNNWSPGDTIESDWANELEEKIGVTNSSDVQSLDFRTSTSTHKTATSTLKVGSGGSFTFRVDVDEDRASTTNLVVDDTATTSNLTISALTNCDTIDTDGTGVLSCGSDDTGSAIGTISTSTTPTIGQIPYWTSSGAFPETQGSVATTSATISTGLSYSGTFGDLIGGSDGTLTADFQTAGRSLTLTANAVDADSELYTTSATANIHATSSNQLATSTDVWLSKRFPQAATITSIDCFAQDTGTSTIQAEIRTSAIAAGSDILYQTGLDCGADEEIASSTLQNTAVSAGDWITVDVPDAEPTGSRPRAVFFSLTWTWDD